MSFIKTGPNSMKLGGHNTYSGGTYLIQGRVQLTGTELAGNVNSTQAASSLGFGAVGTAAGAAQLSNPGGFGTGPVYIFPGAQVFPSGINGANNIIPNDFFLPARALPPRTTGPSAWAP